VSQKNNVLVDAKHCINITTNNKSINLTSSNGKINLKSNNSTSIDSKYGNILVKSDRQDTNIETYRNMEIISEQGNITLEASNGNINIRSLQNINIMPGELSKVTVNGTLHASNITQGLIDGGGLLIPTGSIIQYCGTTSPVGWFICDGSEHDKIPYNKLFEAIRYTFGGEDQMFRVPDLRGKVIVGISQGISGISNKIIGSTGGEETHVLTTNELPSHSHNVDVDINGWHQFSEANTIFDNTDMPNRGSTTLTTTSVGSNDAHNIMQPYMALNFIIKY
jgi:microcystin-dependent protein